MFSIRVFILTFIVFTTAVVAIQHPAEIRYEWKYLNFTWESPQHYQEAVAKGEYIPENNPIVGIKIWKGQLYMTIPRLRKGVPATMVTIPLEPADGNRSPNLQPFPNWAMNRVGNCSAFQSMLSSDVDPKGRLWIMDTGRVALLEENKPLCPPRIVILDLNDHGKILVSYQFPKDVVNPKTSMLNHVVIDHTDGGYAYMSNGDPYNPGIVVFSLEQRKSWAMTDKSMFATAPILKVKNDYVVLIEPFNVDSLALTPVSGEGERQFYYAPVSSYFLFSVPTAALKGKPCDFASNVTVLGTKLSQSRGMVFDASGVIYYGLLADNQVAKWNRSECPITKYQQRAYGDDETLMWPDTFNIESSTKKLWIISNKLHRLYANKIDITKVNFRVVNLGQLEYKSYQYYENGTAPEWPEIKDTYNPTGY